jgi:hypothetical protein
MALPLAELVALGQNGRCFLDREVLKKEWEESGKKTAWFHPTFLRREDVLVSEIDKLPYVIRNEVIVDSAAVPHFTMIRESEGVEKKMQGGLPSVRQVWSGNDFGQQLLTLPGSLAEWKVTLNTPSPVLTTTTPPTPPLSFPSQTQPPPSDASKLQLLEFTAKRVPGGLVRLNGQVMNQSGNPLENVWAKIATPLGPITAPISPKVLEPGSVGLFTRNVRRVGNNDRYKVDLVVGQPKR